MTHSISINERLAQLPPKVGVPFAQLLAADQLSEEALTAILNAGELAGETFRLLGFAVGYLHLQANRVPVDDVIKMAKAQGRSLNLTWSAKRWQLEHDRLARAETLLRLAENNVVYDVSRFEEQLPDRFDGYLIRRSRRLGMEGLRQRHCIASYHTALQRGVCAIAAVFVHRQRWTVEIRPVENTRSLCIVQIKSRYNERPSPSVRQAIHEMLGIPDHASNRMAVDPEVSYMAVLRRILPELRERGVNHVTVGFDGSGDSGAIEWVVCEPVAPAVLDETIPYTKQSRELRGGEWVRVTEETRQPLREIIEDLTYDYLEETGIDWYNDEGGCGELAINVTEGSVTMEVSSRFTESVTQYCRTRDIQTGAEV